MEYLSNLRILGIIIFVFVFFISLTQFRRKEASKIINFFILFGSLILLLISLFPNLLNVFNNIILDFEKPFGKIIFILIFGNIFILFTQLSMFGELRDKIDDLDSIANLKTFPKTFITKILKSIVILIPSFNEEKNILRLINKFPKKIQNLNIFIIILDDGSTDNTVNSLNKLNNKNLLVLKNKNRMGAGFALKNGFNLLKKIGFNGIFVTMDADGQHNPLEIKKIVNPLLREKYDICVGSRITGKHIKSNKVRLAGIYFFSTLLSIFTGKKFTDVSNGFRSGKFNKIENLIFTERQYHVPEFLIKINKNNLKIKEVPVTIYPRFYGESKKGINLFYSLNFFKVIMINFFIK